ncbi:MAG: PEP-CTERM sorting domain-containing protein [Phycisphaeraceae bacterium]|nr:PEP-CTERM sorting domain-containing protein [Phycisphaeraceae bacterium]
MHRFTFALAVLTVACFAAANTAHADVVTVRDSASSNGYYLTGTSASSLRATINGNNYNTYTTGVFNIEANYGSGFQSLITFCLEPNQSINFGTNPPDTAGEPYTLQTMHSYGKFTESEITALDIIWANALGLADDSTRNAAAFQSIVWEMVLDDSFNLDGGDFDLYHSYNNFTQDVFDIANGWYTKATNGTWTSSTHLYVLSNPCSQDYLTPVPEPASLGLIGLGSLMLLGRRRRNRAAA